MFVLFNGLHYEISEFQIIPVAKRKRNQKKNYPDDSQAGEK